MADVRGILLPIYILADESWSMNDVMDQLNQGLESLHNELLEQPMVAAKVRLTILGFSGDVVERVRLADLREVVELPELKARRQTSYQAAFQDLLERIPLDVKELKGQRYGLYRPTVFFLSDGQPDPRDRWKEPYARLTDRSQVPWAPNIIACGIGDADARIIGEVATDPRYAFVAVAGADVGPSIGEFCTELTQSIVKSALAVTQGSAPEVEFQPSGFRMVMDVI